MKVYSAVLLCVSAGLFLAAALLLKGEGGWLHSFDWAAVKNKKKYAQFLGKAVAYLALTALVSALSAYLSIGLAVILLIAGFIAVMVYVVKKAPEHYR